jgi:hypothetical protein
MDQDRQVRFVIPPFFLLGSLLWGAYLADKDLSPLFKPETLKEVLGIVAAAAVALLPIGFAISSLSIFLLRCVAGLTGYDTYEAIVGDETYREIWRRVGAVGESQTDDTLFAVATFDHEILDKGVHLWIFRRWTSVNLSFHTVIALILALCLAPAFKIPLTFAWCLTTALLCLLFLINGSVAWWQVMHMLKFQTSRVFSPKSEPPARPDNPAPVTPAE